MVKSSLWHLDSLPLLLLCGVVFLSTIQAVALQELAAADGVVEARNPLPKKADSPKKAFNPPATVMDEKKKQEKPSGEAAVLAENADAMEIDGNGKEKTEFIVNAETLNEPTMARLARHLKSFHNNQVRHPVQGRHAANNFAEYSDDQDGGLAVPEERAMRRRKRGHHRNANTHHRRTLSGGSVASNRRRSSRDNQRSAIRLPCAKKSSADRRRGGNKKRSKPKSCDKKIRPSGNKKSRKIKRGTKEGSGNRSGQRPRHEHAHEKNESSARKRVSQAA